MDEHKNDCTTSIISVFFSAINAQYISDYSFSALINVFFLFQLTTIFLSFCCFVTFN